MEKLDTEDLDEDELLKDGGMNMSGYGDNMRDRARGAGPYRINTRLETRTDLYSMIFATCFHPEYIKAAEDAA